MSNLTEHDTAMQVLEHYLGRNDPIVSSKFEAYNGWRDEWMNMCLDHMAWVWSDDKQVKITYYDNNQEQHEVVVSRL